MDNLFKVTVWSDSSNVEVWIVRHCEFSHKYLVMDMVLKSGKSLTVYRPGYNITIEEV